MYLLGFDCGTSSIKATLLDAQTGKAVGSVTWPEREMEIISVKSGWAEQKPEIWWENLKDASNMLMNKSGVDKKDVKAIGISYQMHGLVCVDKQGEPIRPSIIWCDSRAVKIGEAATSAMGNDIVLSSMLNSIGNFTAAKLAWVKENEPDIYEKIHKIMLPGDYIGYKMTDRIITTGSGMSEGVFWDYQKGCISEDILEHFGFAKEIFPDVMNTFGDHGSLTKGAAKELGLAEGTFVSYRAGDQPNNAYSLGVIDIGQVAATAGTSGVVYGITDKLAYDPKSRVNTFMHVNNTPDDIRNGVLLCVNGAGILNSWVKHNFASGLDYAEMDRIALDVPIGSDGLVILPYGNGAERTLENHNIGGSVHYLDFNTHTKNHIYRASQEAVAFAMYYGLDGMSDVGVKANQIRAGKSNMFLSLVFTKTFATMAGVTVQLYSTDGSQGAARGAGVGCGIYKTVQESFIGLELLETVEPDEANRDKYTGAYTKWLDTLQKQ